MQQQELEEDAISLLSAYEDLQQLTPLFKFSNEGTLPLVTDNSNIFADYPLCTLGVLTAESGQGVHKGIAVIVEDNYLLTCASNCYSHTCKVYSNITFTIQNNKIGKYDTYQISHAFIPEDYKMNFGEKGYDYNYALLKIKGQPNLKDKYGSLGVDFCKHESSTLTYLDCVLNENNGLQLVAERKLKENVRVALDGGPIIYHNHIVGLTFGKGKLLTQTLNFNQQMYSQFKQSSII